MDNILFSFINYIVIYCLIDYLYITYILFNLFILIRKTLILIISKKFF